jgi:hypothetical protein
MIGKRDSGVKVFYSSKGGRDMRYPASPLATQDMEGRTSQLADDLRQKAEVKERVPASEVTVVHHHASFLSTLMA